MVLHNTDKTESWKKGVTQFADMTNEEFKGKYLGFDGSKVVEEP